LALPVHPECESCLAEDERELATWLVRALAQSDFQVDWVDDGRMVRRSLKATRYDALILDLGLPGLGGHDVLADLREADQRLPVLILTARDSLIERVSSLHEGADDFLAKPFEVAELEARLVALIRRARGSDHPRFRLRSAGVRCRHQAVHFGPRAADLDAA
jgi:two-component system, OmpR family, response regulator TctD